MILSTSGTTGRPKGVVSSHSAIEAQIGCLVEAWEWSRDDRILLTLPLHHVHGIVNVVSCALWSGSTVEMAPGFDVEATWNRLASGELTLYMAVPTVYRRLIERWTEVDEAEQSRFRAGCGALRLMVSGSAALPVDTLRRWEQMTGHVLLERYGMTEIGMALSNPLRGERTPGAVGSALPGVEVRLVADDGSECADGDPGEIEVRTPGMFSEYWNMPEATLAAFRDGWFRTGDVAVRSDGIYRILGRSSIDIIKTGGEKVSALEIEDVLIGHDRVGEVAVVGVPDDVWGERIVAAVVARSPVGAEELRAWCRRSLAGYKVPKEVVFVESLPRNSLGKVMKTRVVTEMSNRE
jgi:malonyl-CoA/methylmalonyl-CoA synthetase